jgi:hypothetical protein
VLVVPDPSEPWSRFIMDPPAQISFVMRITSVLISESVEVAPEALVEIGWSATTEVAGTEVAWNDTATVASSASQ